MGDPQSTPRRGYKALRLTRCLPETKFDAFGLQIGLEHLTTNPMPPVLLAIAATASSVLLVRRNVQQLFSRDTIASAAIARSGSAGAIRIASAPASSGLRHTPAELA
jgi:hypothetical protein